MKLKLLLIEDDDKLLAEMKSYFETAYDVYLARTLSHARALLSEVAPDAAVLDLILPDGTGTSLLIERELTCPTVILTTMSADEDRIDGLDAGAKDYLIKPVSMRVLAKHLSVRLAPKSESVLISGKLLIDTNRRIVLYGEKQVPLTSTEFDILVYLFESSDSFHTAQEIYGAIYGDMFLQSTTIKKHLSALRYKLSEVAPDENYILTAYGKGYRFRKEPY